MPLVGIRTVGDAALDKAAARHLKVVSFSLNPELPQHRSAGVIDVLLCGNALRAPSAGPAASVGGCTGKALAALALHRQLGQAPGVVRLAAYV